MCIGEGTGDTLHEGDTCLIAAAVDRELPAHAFTLRRNRDGLTWVVLDPHDPADLRFTICRIDPCVMVMVEDPFTRRQFRSVATVADAMTFVRDVVDQAGLDDTERVLH